MRRLGIGENVLYLEMTEGGHAGAADNAARAKVKTIEYRFLVDALEKPAWDRCALQLYAA